MKIKSAGILTAATLVLAAGNANANLLFDIYGGATIGMGASTTFYDGHSDTHSAQSYGAVIGLDIPLFRVEAEYNYLYHDAEKLHIGMLNAYAKMPTLMLQPYIGAGVGAVFAGSSDYDTDIDTRGAYQAMLGVTFDVPVLPLKFDAEARALYANGIYEIADKKADVLHYDLRLKMRYIF